MSKFMNKPWFWMLLFRLVIFFSFWKSVYHKLPSSALSIKPRAVYTRQYVFLWFSFLCMRRNMWKRVTVTSCLRRDSRVFCFVFFRKRLSFLAEEFTFLVYLRFFLSQSLLQLLLLDWIQPHTHTHTHTHK